jgi:diguanylate cyclase (GGDEF)-like protein
MEIDLHTLALMIGIMGILQAGAVLAQYFSVKEYLGMSYWAAGDALIAIGFSLNLLRDVIPLPLVTIVLANSLIISGVMLIQLGILRFLGRKASWLATSSIFFIYLISILYFTYIQYNISLRVAIVSGTLAIYLLLCAYALFKYNEPAYRSMARFTGGVLFLSGLFMLIRSVSALVLPPIDNIYAPSVFQLAYFLTALISSYLWTVGMISMVSRRLTADLRIQATTDFLTRRPNRRAIQAIIEREAALSARNGQPYSLAMIDIDRFKDINDTFGHQIGDQVLIKVMERVEASIRHTDQVGRWGGDEFLLLMPGTHPNAATGVIERIIEEVTGTSVLQARNNSIWCTLSIGVAGSTHPLSELGDILTAADLALYQAKQNGRNQYVIAPYPNG